MATYAAETPTIAGLAATPRSAAASDKVPGGTLLRVTNGSGGALTVTVVTPATFDGLAIADATVSVPNGTYRYIRIPSSALYVDPADNLVTVNFSATTTVTYDVISYPS